MLNCATDPSILGRTEFYMSHDLLSKFPDRVERTKDNLELFIHDLVQGTLDSYSNTYVAYQKGILCGQSRNGKELHTTVKNYYGENSITVFMVPEDIKKSLEECILSQSKTALCDGSIGRIYSRSEDGKLRVLDFKDIVIQKW